MRLIEVVEGEETSPRPCSRRDLRAGHPQDADPRRRVPGFVVNRILLSTASEVWRDQDEYGVPSSESTSHQGARPMPMGPFRVADMSGLDTVLQVAQDLQAAYGDRFYVHRGMQERVGRGELGAKSGKGFYEHALTRTPQLDERIAERFS